MGGLVSAPEFYYLGLDVGGECGKILEVVLLSFKSDGQL